MVQEPVTATVTGVTRVRQGSIRADGTSTTLIGAVRVRTSGAASQSLYAIDDYWVNGYADYGDGSSVRIAGNVTSNRGVLSETNSATLIGAFRTTDSGVLSEADVTTLAGALKLTNSSVISLGQASTIASGSMTYSSLVISAATSTALGALSQKWTRFEPVDETWTEASDVSELWTEIDDTTETWTTQ